MYNKEAIQDIPENTLCLNIDDSLFFEILLMEIRGTSISHASYRKKERNLLEKNLIDQINELESKHMDSETDLEILNEKKQLGHRMQYSTT